MLWSLLACMAHYENIIYLLASFPCQSQAYCASNMQGDTLLDYETVKGTKGIYTVKILLEVGLKNQHVLTQHSDLNP